MILNKSSVREFFLKDSTLYALTTNGETIILSRPTVETTPPEEVTVSAGSDETITTSLEESSQRSTVYLGNSKTIPFITIPFNSLTWDSDGDGFFDDNTLLLPQYTPGGTDISNGKVTLTLTVITNEETIESSIVIRILDTPPITTFSVDFIDDSSISWSWIERRFNLARLSTVETAITLTISNVNEGDRQVLSVIKNTASDVSITLTGTALDFYGYDNADYGTTPIVVLSGASGNIFDISFIARTNNLIGVSVNSNGN